MLSAAKALTVPRATLPLSVRCAVTMLIDMPNLLVRRSEEDDELALPPDVSAGKTCYNCSFADRTLWDLHAALMQRAGDGVCRPP
jgi:hypothetical protein